MSDVTDKRVIAARRRACTADATREHTSSVKLDDDSVVAEADAIALIDAGALFTMPHPKAHLVRDNGAQLDIEGIPLALQVRECDGCHERVLWA